MKRVLMVFLVVICLVLMSGCNIDSEVSFLLQPQNTRSRLENWLSEYREAFEEAVQNSGLPYSTVGQDLVNQFSNTGVWFVSVSDTGEYCIWFQGTDLPETERYLIYNPDDNERIADTIGVLHDDDRMQIETDTGTKMVWRGGGATMQGYVVVEELFRCWYYVEIYNPT